jgi:hypothetical protein
MDGARSGGTVTPFSLECLTIRSPTGSPPSSRWFSIFISPLVIYSIWIVLSKGKIMNMRFFWPLVVGLFLMTSTLFISALFYENSTNKKYNHPEVINGELREGFFTNK